MMMCQQRTTRSPLSAGGPSSFTLFLSLSFVCVCVYVVNIYITTTIRVPSFPLRSFPKGSRVQPKCGVKDENLKYEFMNSRVCVCVCVCVSRVSLSLSGLVVVLLFRRCFLSLAFWTFFFPKSCRNVVKVSFSFSRVLSWFF